MRSKAPLMLIELTVMLLVLALAAGLCLQVFLWADRKAEESIRQDTAMVQLQNAAEVLKHSGGDYAAAAQELGGSWDGRMLCLRQDEILVQIRPEQKDTALLGGAVLEAFFENVVIARLQVCWQEVEHGK